MASPGAFFGSWEGARSSKSTCDLVCLYQIPSAAPSTSIAPAPEPESLIQYNCLRIPSRTLRSSPPHFFFLPLQLFPSNSLLRPIEVSLFPRSFFFANQFNLRIFSPQTSTHARGLPASYYNGHLHHRSLRRAQPISAPLGRHAPLQLENNAYLKKSSLRHKLKTHSLLELSYYCCHADAGQSGIHAVWSRKATNQAHLSLTRSAETHSTTCQPTSKGTNSTTS